MGDILVDTVILDTIYFGAHLFPLHKFYSSSSDRPFLARTGPNDSFNSSGSMLVLVFKMLATRRIYGPPEAIYFVDCEVVKQEAANQFSTHFLDYLNMIQYPRAFEDAAWLLSSA